LQIPLAVKRDTKSVEMIRVFIVEGKQWTSINTDLFQDHSFTKEEAWGMFLADTIRHLANAISLHTGKEQYDIETDIFDALNEELVNPTSTARGGYSGS
jgi:hypothetical protein